MMDICVKTSAFFIYRNDILKGQYDHSSLLARLDQVPCYFSPFATERKLLQVHRCRVHHGDNILITQYLKAIISVDLTS